MIPLPRRGVLFIGDKGVIQCDGAGGAPRIFPESLRASIAKPAQTLKRVAGHHRDWIDACKGGGAASSNFEYGAKLTEITLVGVLAQRMRKPIEWDAASMRATGLPFIPGVTTLQRTWGDVEGAEPEKRPLDLDLYVDCSGSMPNPQAATSFLTLAGAIVAISAMRVGARVQATLWSGPRQFETTNGFTNDLDHVLRILTGYLGYFQWDVILRPALSALARQAGPIEEILIDRISPDDATTLVKAEAGKSVLLGGAFAGFGGFLSRTARENDYLWGRLHAIDRLIDIVASTGGAGAGEGGLEVRAFKKRAFEMVLEEEAGRLQSIGALIARLKELVARL